MTERIECTWKIVLRVMFTFALKNPGWFSLLRRPRRNEFESRLFQCFVPSPESFYARLECLKRAGPENVGRGRCPVVENHFAVVLEFTQQ
jgi:hypothetical protein